jgi:site-specific DNA recombinase
VGGGDAATDRQITPLGPAVLYAAKSTPDERESIPDQLKEARAFAKDKELEVAGQYGEQNVSAYKGRGPELAAALEHAEKIGATLIVQHSDRLARGDGKQARHLVEIALWALKAGVRIHCIQDPSTFENLVMAVVMGERNTEDSRRKALAVKAGLARRRQRGLHNGGTAGYGYLYRRNADDERERVPDSALVPIVRRMFAEYLTGRGYTAIGGDLNAEGLLTGGGKPWRACTVRAILINPIYAGLIRDGEELIPAQHEAIVDRETWEQAQVLREAKAATHKRGRPSAGKHLFRKGFLRCGTCGGSMGPVTDRRQGATAYETYICHERHRDPGLCTMPSIHRSKVDDAIYAYFRDLELDVRATREQLAGAMERRLTEARELLGAAEQEAQEAAGRLARVKRDYIAGDLTAAEWRELRGELEPEAAGAEAEAENLRVQLAEAEAGTALTDVEADVLEALSEIRRSLADEVKDANGAAAIRAVLMRLFDGFVLHQGVPDGQDHVELAGTRYWIEPLVSERVVARYGAKFRPVMAQGDNCFDPIPGTNAFGSDDPAEAGRLDRRLQGA